MGVYLLLAINHHLIRYAKELLVLGFRSHCNSQWSRNLKLFIGEERLHQISNVLCSHGNARMDIENANLFFIPNGQVMEIIVMANLCLMYQAAEKLATWAIKPQFIASLHHTTLK